MSWNRLAADLLFLIVFAAVFATPASASLVVKTCAAAPAVSTMAYQDMLNCQISAAGALPRCGRRGHYHRPGSYHRQRPRLLPVDIDEWHTRRQ